MKTPETKSEPISKIKSELNKTREATEISEDLIDILVYKERKDGDYVSEEEALEFLRSHGKI